MPLQLLQSARAVADKASGGFYDFTSDLSSKDTAYTSESLEPHTDTTYFTDPIVSPISSASTLRHEHPKLKRRQQPQGLQALHLLSHTDGEGGLSSLVDGFSAARDLFEEDANAYATLSKIRVFAHASGNEGVNIQPAKGFPVLGHTRTGGTLQQVRWNTADRAWVGASFKRMEEWYDAAA